MFSDAEFIQGSRFANAFYSPRFCSTLPWTDHTENQGSELRGTLDNSDGYNSNCCFSLHSYIGGKTKKQELILFKLDEMLFAEPLILSVVCKGDISAY